MFESILHRGRVGKGRLGMGATFSAAVHIGVLGLAVHIGSRPSEPPKKGVDITFIQPPPPPSPNNAPSPAGQSPARRPRSPRRDAVDTNKRPEIAKQAHPIVEDSTTPPEQAIATAPPTAPSGDTDRESEPGGDDIKSKDVTGIADGPPGDSVLPPQNGTIPFGAGMTMPSMISGRPPAYTKEALAAGVHGTMSVRCTITTQGNVTRCRVIKTVAHMEAEVLDALYSRKYNPVIFNGAPVNIDYLFTIKLELPTR